MTLKQHVMQRYGWQKYEAKQLKFTITDALGAPVSILGAALRFVLMNKAEVGQAEGTAVITKLSGSGVTVEGAGNNVMVVTFVSATDYTNIVENDYYYECWNDTVKAQLAYGDIYIGEGVAA